MEVMEKMFFHCNVCRTRHDDELLEVMLTYKTLTIGCKTCGREVLELTPRKLSALLTKMKKSELKCGACDDPAAEGNE